MNQIRDKVSLGRSDDKDELKRVVTSELEDLRRSINQLIIEHSVSQSALLHILERLGKLEIKVGI